MTNRIFQLAWAAALGAFITAARGTSRAAQVQLHAAPPAPLKFSTRRLLRSLGLLARWHEPKTQRSPR